MVLVYILVKNLDIMNLTERAEGKFRLLFYRLLCLYVGCDISFYLFNDFVILRIFLIEDLRYFIKRLANIFRMC